MLHQAMTAPSWQIFDHLSDVGIRGYGFTLSEAFEQIAYALTSAVTNLNSIESENEITIHCSAPDYELLLMDWLNEIIYAMSFRKMLFNRFCVTIENTVLSAKMYGQHIDRKKHSPSVEPKGATFAELKVTKLPSNIWLAQCVVDI